MMDRQPATICDLIDQLARVSEKLDRVSDSVQEAARLYVESERWSETALGIWISTTDTSKEFSASHIADSPFGFATELARTGQASATPGTASRQPDPYTIELLPVADLDPVYSADRVKLRRTFFCAFDPTLNPAGAGQNATAIAEIIASKGGDRALLQSDYRFAQIGFWQPNFFRPILLCNNNPVVYGNLARAEVDKGHQGHLSVGIPNPWWSECDVHLGKVQSKGLRAFAQMGQIIPTAQLIQRYTVYMVAEFQLGGKL